MIASGEYLLATTRLNASTTSARRTLRSERYWPAKDISTPPSISALERTASRVSSPPGSRATSASIASASSGGTLVASTSCEARAEAAKQPATSARFALPSTAAIRSPR